MLTKKITPPSVKLAYTKVDGDPDLPPILFIHGRRSTKDTWDSCMKDGIRNTRYAIDLRGHGESIYEGTDFSLKAMEEDITAFLQEQGINKLIIIAHSMGSRVATYFCANHPNLICGLLIEDMDMRVRKPNLINEDELIKLSKFKRSFPTIEDVTEYLDTQKYFNEEKVKKIYQEASRLFKVDEGYYLGSSPYTDHLTYQQIQCSSEPKNSFDQFGELKIEFPVHLLIADYESEVTNEGVKAMQDSMPEILIKRIKRSSHSIHRTQVGQFLLNANEFLEKCLTSNNNKPIKPK